MKLAILGGSFNPFHNGHLALAKAVYKEYAYDKIAIIPAFISPFKQESADSAAAGAHRIKMIRLAIKKYPYMYCETCEIEKKGVSYTTDTLDYLYKKCFSYDLRGEINCSGGIEGKIGVIIGSDLAGTLFAWKEPYKILERSDIIIGRRLCDKDDFGKTGTGEAGFFEGAKCMKKPYPFKVLETAIPYVSSTEVRFAILHGLEFKHLVPEPVHEYIITNRLYGAVL